MNLYIQRKILVLKQILKKFSTLIQLDFFSLIENKKNIKKKKKKKKNEF